LVLCVLAASALVLGGIAHMQQQNLVVYTSVDEENAKKLLDAFSRATGIRVQMVFLSSGPALTRIEAEQRNPQADVWFGAPAENHEIAKARGLTQPYVSPEAAGLPAQFKDAEGYWHAIYINPLGFGVRTDILERRGVPVPASWADLIKPEYRGLIQMPSPQASGTAYNQLVTLVQIMGEDRAIEYLKQLDRNVQTYTQSGTAPSRAVASGEAAIAIQFTPAFLGLIDQGFPVRLVFPREGVGFESAAVSILAGARNLDTARRLVAWITSKEGQDALASEKTYFFPVRADAVMGAGLPSFADVPTIDYDTAFASANRTRLIQRFVNEVLGQ
jgi:iron(III) transport system substrate-binding protein